MSTRSLVFRPHKQEPAQSIQPTHDPAFNSAIRTYVVQGYQTHRLGSRLWDCATCGRDATDIYRSAISFLLPYTSRTVDFLIPACKSSGCHHHASKMAHEFGKTAMPGEAVEECVNCGARSGVHLCGSCTFSHSAWTGTKRKAPPQQRQKPRHGTQQDEVKH
ncbi:uncharacterized protein LY89DRAFT_666998 [Mollisia scopiformis]|uniref:Uncharacterized protein n=1 Tax=Mollisia scopiformis TaxID=149040 RepID=A0A194XJ44_MOLSC|nr:uncharacterized protein LY89DRAFT_666998 [Mollisia scopiformis]KUJ20183.1 hypothetical protein LY89DRAFT_666998 [Mollisia scopiformis]